MNDFLFYSVARNICELDLLIPDPLQVEQGYRNANGKMPFPYWSRIWPSGVALANWLREEPQRVEGKLVLELGAGLGLPSLIAAQYADHVIISDHVPDALTWSGLNVSGLGLRNVECRLINWHQDEIPQANVLLMSDVGYDPLDFERLYHLICNQLKTGGSVLLAVPERSVSVVFIEMLQEFHHSKRIVAAEGVRVSLFAFTGMERAGII
jgi:predicted nicotinamide N-methyase